MKENQIIKQLHNRRNSKKLDDCFFFDEKYLITTDTITEGTHFKHEWSSPADIACKLVEVNVSDIASSGGLPKIAFLNLGLSRFSQDSKWLSPFIKHLKISFNKYKITLEGGDTYFSEKTNLTLTVIGKTNSPIFRSTGMINDFIYMTGNIGLSQLGFRILKDNIKLPAKLTKEALDKHLRPQSRLSLSRILAKQFPISAMMDITDGLIQDSKKLAQASNLKIEIHIDKIPGIKELQKYISIDEILSSGEELELLFLSKSKINSTKNLPVTCIGKAVKGKQGVSFILNHKRYIPTKEGFFHF